MKSEEVDKRLKLIKEYFEKGMITEKGYKKAKANLEWARDD